ncbi:hypothetical protein [Thermococcus sp.]
MRKFGAVLVLLGLLILLKQLRPDFLLWLEPYAGHIKAAFWGITLIALGLHILIRDRMVKTLILVLYLIYLALYLVV